MIWSDRQARKSDSRSTKAASVRREMIDSRLPECRRDKKRKRSLLTFFPSWLKRTHGWRIPKRSLRADSAGREARGAAALSRRSVLCRWTKGSDIQKSFPKKALFELSAEGQSHFACSKSCFCHFVSHLESRLSRQSVSLGFPVVLFNFLPTLKVASLLSPWRLLSFLLLCTPAFFHSAAGAAAAFSILVGGKKMMRLSFAVGPSEGTQEMRSLCLIPCCLTLLLSHKCEGARRWAEICLIEAACPIRFIGVQGVLLVTTPTLLKIALSVVACTSIFSKTRHLLARLEIHKNEGVFDNRLHVAKFARRIE